MKITSDKDRDVLLVSVVFIAIVQNIGWAIFMYHVITETSK